MAELSFGLGWVSIKSEVCWVKSREYKSPPPVALSSIGEVFTLVDPGGHGSGSELEGDGRWRREAWRRLWAAIGSRGSSAPLPAETALPT